MRVLRCAYCGGFLGYARHLPPEVAFVTFCGTCGKGALTAEEKKQQDYTTEEQEE